VKTAVSATGAIPPEQRPNKSGEAITHLEEVALDALITRNNHTLNRRHRPIVHRAIVHRPLVHRPLVRGLAVLFLCAALPCLRAQTNVVTYHNDNARTGQNTTETLLTPANVNSSQFGKLYSANMDGFVYAQPLVVTNVTNIAGGTHDVAYVATENDTLYAIDANNASILWQKSFINPPAVTTIPSTDISTQGTCIGGQYGVTGTPVIDRSSGTIYLVALTKENGAHVQTLHAIDIASGAEKFGGPKVIQATVTAGAGNLSFDPLTSNQRPALLLQDGHVIITWGAYCDLLTWHGWVMSYNASTLSQEAALAITPTGNDGGVWMGGAGPAGDENSNIYVVSGNGTYDGSSNFGDTILKLTAPSNGSFTTSDWFTPYNQNTLDLNDDDLGSGGVLLLPTLSLGQQLLVQVSKAGTIYLIDRNNMGKLCSTCSTGDTQIVQEIPGAIAGMWGVPAYWNGHIYLGGANDNGTPDNLKAYSFNANNSGRLSTAFTSESAESFNFPGPTPSVSANGNSNGIVWILDNGGFTPTLFPGRIPTPGSNPNQILHAYDATNLTPLYNSNQAANSRDVPGGALQFTVPTVANGKVYVGSTATFSIFGLRSGPLVQLSPATVTFNGAIAVGSTTNAKTVTLTNTGTSPVTLTGTGTSMGGTNASDFSATNNCGSSVAVGASCTISITFHPAAVGTRSALVLVSDNVSGSPQTIPVTGTGSDVKLSANGHGFSATIVGQTSSPFTVTLTNVGATTLSITSISLGGTNPADFTETNNCGSSVAASATCALTLAFHPTTTGTRTSLVSITDNGGGSPQTISLSGTGTSSSALANGTYVVSNSAGTLVWDDPAFAKTSGTLVDLWPSNGGSNQRWTFTAIANGYYSITNVSSGLELDDPGSSTTSGTKLVQSTLNSTATDQHWLVTQSGNGYLIKNQASGLLVDASSNTQNTDIIQATASGSSSQVWMIRGTSSPVSLTPSSLTFSSQTVGTTSAAQSVTLKNNGSATLSITSIAASGDYAQTNTCGTSVAAGSSCTISVTFHPTTTGTRTGTVTIADNAAGSPETINLTGTGATSSGAQVQLSPSSVTFSGAVLLGQSTSATTVTLANTGTATLTITGISLGGANPSDFTQTNTCGSSVAAGAHCGISVTFHPTAAGTRSASVLISDDASGSPQSIAVSGLGTEVKLSATSESFPAIAVGQTSAPQTVTLTNVGSTALSITSISVAGTNPSDFTETNNCGSSVAASGSCTLTFTFHPTATGTRSASVSITDNGGASPQTISLSGTGGTSSGAQVQLSPSTVTFYAPIAVGQTTTNPKTVTLTNTGTATLSITSIAMSGADPSDFSQTNTCGSSVAAGATCTISINFQPTAIDTRTASVSISDNAAGSPQTVPLSGPGTYVKLSGNGHGFPTTTVGQTSSPYSVTLTNVGPTALTISSITLGGTNPSDFTETNNCGSSVASNGSCTLTMTFHPTVTGTRSALVSISDNGGSSPQTISLSGTGQ
jgi:hypothetical protein